MVYNLKFSGGSQYLQYIHDLLMEPYFGLTDNIIPQMMGKLSQMLNMYKGHPETSTLNEEITGPYKYKFMPSLTYEIKWLEQHGTWVIFFRNSVTGDHILLINWDFKIKRFVDVRL